MINKIISGGQTGADVAGLEAGRILKLETGGTAPNGFRTETGSNPALKELYGLIEHENYNYRSRTIENVKNSDATIWFGNESSPGGKLTINSCKKFGKPYIINPTKEAFIRWINWNNIVVLNVAGNRESTNPGIFEKVKNFLVDTLRRDINANS